MMQYSQWNGFRGGEWQRAIDVRSFIQKNYTLYEGDDSFLVPPTERAACGKSAKSSSSRR